MKKLLSILVLYFLFSGSAYAEKITFSKCANKKHDFKFKPNIYEKNLSIIDTDKGIVSHTTIFTDARIKKWNEEFPDSENPKYIFYEDKIHSFNEFVVKTRSEFKNDNLESIREAIYDLKSKKIQITRTINYRLRTKPLEEITYIQCQ